MWAITAFDRVGTHGLVVKGRVVHRLLLLNATKIITTFCAYSNSVSSPGDILASLGLSLEESFI